VQGKNYKDFKVVFVGHSGYVDLYDLKVGDYFMEDTYPEVYQVRATASPGGSVLADCITDGVKGIEWMYAASAYAPCLVKLEPK